MLFVGFVYGELQCHENHGGCQNQIMIRKKLLRRICGHCSKFGRKSQEAINFLERTSETDMNKRMRLSLAGAWNGAFGAECSSPAAFAETEGMTKIPATVPGALETDLEAAGFLPPIFSGENVLLTYPIEHMHYCLSRTFSYTRQEGTADFLVFEGLDCFGEIYIDGEHVGSCDNMLIPHRFVLPELSDGEHELFVHIRPATVEARKYPIQPTLQGMLSNWDSLYVRKAPHMYGWDIMPRIVSSGIWRDVYIERLPLCRVTDVYAVTVSADENWAKLRIFYNTEIGGASVHDFRLHVTLRCGDSVIEREVRMWHTGGQIGADIQNPKRWWPRNYGEPDLYTVTAELYRGDILCDVYETRMGVRTVELIRTSTTDAAGNGEFCFKINGKKVFAMGTNWVPVDAIHARDRERLPDILPMLNDLGCNIVRCWGGNVYEDDLFYDFCDENGIMIWQDFAMACGLYPQDAFFREALRKEAEAVVLRLRHHPAILLWAGDNECDCSYQWTPIGYAPESNVLTREVLPDVIRRMDLFRPYLPSSPFIDEEAYRTGKPTSEDHTWGPRDYFKGDYYRNTVCHFASEIGYHGCPSPQSLAKFIDEDHLWPCLGDKQWLVHAATMDGRVDHPFGYRIKLMWDQVETLFGKGGAATDNLEAFSLASQISQAEAKKYFIERFRLTKWRRTGIIWWNLIDGWPQISDAIVDYYGDRKLAYDYIKRSQKPFCMMFDEPENGSIALYGVNDTRTGKGISFTVEDDSGRIVAQGDAYVEADQSVPVCRIPAGEEKRYYLIRWTGDDAGMNHYFANSIDVDFDYYKTLLPKLKG